MFPRTVSCEDTNLILRWGLVAEGDMPEAISERTRSLVPIGEAGTSAVAGCKSHITNCARPTRSCLCIMVDFPPTPIKKDRDLWYSEGSSMGKEESEDWYGIDLLNFTQSIRNSIMHFIHHKAFLGNSTMRDTCSLTVLFFNSQLQPYLHPYSFFISLSYKNCTNFFLISQTVFLNSLEIY